MVDGEVTALQAAGVQPTDTHVVLGRAVDEVLRLRDAVDADLIVIGSRGRNAFIRVLLGSGRRERRQARAVLGARREEAVMPDFTVTWFDAVVIITYLALSRVIPVVALELHEEERQGQGQGRRR